MKNKQSHRRSGSGATRVTRFEGLPIVDAHKNIDIVINKKDVSESKKRDPSNCAAALAGRRELKTDVRVYMTRTYVRDNKKKRWIRFLTPMAIQKEIISFDRGAEFEPGEYVFRAPKESEKLGYNPHGGHRGETGKQKRPRHMTGNVRVSASNKVY